MKKLTILLFAWITLTACTKESDNVSRSLEGTAWEYDYQSGSYISNSRMFFTNDNITYRSTPGSIENGNKVYNNSLTTYEKWKYNYKHPNLTVYRPDEDLPVSYTVSNDLQTIYRIASSGEEIIFYRSN